MRERSAIVTEEGTILFVHLVVLETLRKNYHPTHGKQQDVHKPFTHALQKYLKDNKHDSSDITCFSKFTVSPHNCTHLGTDNVRGQLSVPVFAPNEGCSFSINFSLIYHLFGRPVHRFD